MQKRGGASEKLEAAQAPQGAQLAPTWVPLGASPPVKKSSQHPEGKRPHQVMRQRIPQGDHP